MMRDHKKELRHALTDVHRVIRALGLEKGAQRQATGLTICCPWHKENTPSCSVTLGKDGTIRLRCFGCQATGAGCRSGKPKPKPRLIGFADARIRST